MSDIIGKKTRRKIFELYNGKCDICGRILHNNKENYRDINYMQIDHMIPRANGGGNGIENLRALCKPCNSSRCNYSGEVLKNKLIKNFTKSDLFQGNDYERLIDDIKNNFINKDDLMELYSCFEKVTLNNIRAFKLLKGKLSSCGGEHCE